MRVKTGARTERRKGHAVTIHEVAKHAGVSLMTVSRVMNSNSNVREATRELVMRAVRELNYTPNAAARSLAAAQGTRIAHDGFHAAISAAGLTIDPALIQQGYFTYRSGLEATEKLLTRKSPPTAIFASNDDMAAAAVSVAHRRGLDVPRDLSVVGFDDTPTATTVWPELTTIRQPIAAMAGSAVELLLRSIRQRKGGDARVVSDHVMAHALIKRDSVAAPRKG